jgi:hypothetical protein
MSLEETLRRIREKNSTPTGTPGGTAPHEPTEGAGTPGDIEDDPLINAAMKIFEAEVEGWGEHPPTPEGWENIHRGVR